MAYAQSLFSIYIFWASFGFFLFFYFVQIFLKFNWILTGTVQKYVCCLGQMHIHFSCPRENLYCQNCNELFGVYPFFNPFRWHQLHWNVIKIETRSSLCSPLFCEPNAHRGVDDMIASGSGILESLISQRMTLGGAHKRIQAIGSTLGLSNHTMKLIERRLVEDRRIFIGGIVVTLLVIALIIYFLVL